MTTIEITPEIREDITKGIKEADSVIEREMAISADLRNYDTIERHMDYLRRMKTALQTGEL